LRWLPLIRFSSKPFSLHFITKVIEAYLVQHLFSKNKYNGVSLPLGLWLTDQPFIYQQPFFWPGCCAFMSSYPLCLLGLAVPDAGVYDVEKLFPDEGFIFMPAMRTNRPLYTLKKGMGRAKSGWSRSCRPNIFILSKGWKEKT
jgi:hypothetical protein